MLISEIKKLYIAYTFVLGFFLAGGWLFSSGKAIFNLTQAGRQESLKSPKVLGASVTDFNAPKKPEFAGADAGTIDIEGVLAESILVFNVSTGEILGEKNANKQTAIASLTKLMTGLVVYENSDMTQYVDFKAGDVSKFEPDLDIRVGERVKVQDLFDSMIVGSANDSALALARYVQEKTQKSFVQLMNEKAGELGMENSSFSNSTGFDSYSNYSTAADLQKLIMATQKHAVFSNLGRASEYVFFSQSGKKYAIRATNKLIRENLDLEAVKTGHTAMARGAMASIFKIKNLRIAILVLGSPDREKDTLVLKQRIQAAFNP